MSGPLTDLPTQPPLIPAAATPPQGLSRTLREQYGATPLSVLDKRAGWWQKRRAGWLDLGIQSEVGRPGDLTYRHAFDGQAAPYTSIFDPVLAELVYHWWSRPGDLVLDPFCGGSVRGVVASWLGRWYYGVDLSGAQIAADRGQAGIASPDLPPVWIQGDARRCHELLPDVDADLIFTCPPYADLEVYSDDPRDLSTMDYPAFLDALVDSLRAALRLLRPGRFVVLVLGDVRDSRGQLRGITSDVVVRLRDDLGLTLHSQAVLLTPAGTVGMQMGRHFQRHRKLGRVHQDVIVMAHGSASDAAGRCSAEAAS